MEPLVSVIIPVYNVLPYIREALDSVLHQTWQRLEIIIVDDGSDDGSEAVCDEYRRDDRVIVIHQENRGLSGARNTGLDRMTGEYVAFLDSDDAFHPEMIQRMVEAVRRTGAELAVCGYEIRRSEGRLTGAGRTGKVSEVPETVLSSREVHELVCKGRFNPSVWNKLYRADLWEGLRFPEGRVYEDTFVLPRILEKCGRTAAVRQPLVLYRKRKGSITETSSVQNIRDCLESHGALGKYLRGMNPPLPEKSLEKYLENARRDLIVQWAQTKRTGADPEVCELVEAEIRRYSGKKLPDQRMRSRAAWWLYNHCPAAVYPVWACFQVVKKMMGEDRSPVL